MDKIKDFIYNKSDIVIALLILAVAALIIAWRLEIIVQYPKTLSDGNVAKQVQEETSDEETPEMPKDTSEQKSKDNSEVELPLWQDGKLTKEVEIEVSGNTATDVVNLLIKEGLFEDYSEYQAICEKAGLNHEKVKAGLVTFKKGSTKKAVAKTINWG